MVQSGATPALMRPILDHSQEPARTPQVSFRAARPPPQKAAPKYNGPGTMECRIRGQGRSRTSLCFAAPAHPCALAALAHPCPSRHQHIHVHCPPQAPRLRKSPAIVLQAVRLRINIVSQVRRAHQMFTDLHRRRRYIQSPTPKIESEYACGSGLARECGAKGAHGIQTGYMGDTRSGTWLTPFSAFAGPAARVSPGCTIIPGCGGGSC